MSVNDMDSGRLIPELKTVGELFHEASYTIPIYQRNYAWGVQHIEQLIADIHDAFVDKQEGYLLGNLIVTKRTDSAQNITYEVIDGQQRLTTLYLLLIFLAEDEKLQLQLPPNCLRYESRPRATEALQHVAGGASRREEQRPEDASIYEGFNVIRQFISQHAALSVEGARGDFAGFLRSKVTVVRASLPHETDLNRYFEIMNTRGQQLQQVDILKARLMSHLDSEAERACFAWIWEACADMDSYVQMSLTRGDTTLRSEVFGVDWSWLTASDFEVLNDIHQQKIAMQSPGAGASIEVLVSTHLSLDDALDKYSKAAVSTLDEGSDNERFRSTIVFPIFLLHVLKIINGNNKEQEGDLDDKQLIRRFDEVVKKNDNTAEWVRSFVFNLIKCRNLFDSFILKRQYTATNSDDGDWSLQRFLKREYTRKLTPDYSPTFSQPSVTVEDGEGVDVTTKDIVLLQSMLRITYTSPSTMHWITALLKYIFTQENPIKVDGKDISNLLREYARDKVKEAFFKTDPHPVGFSISRIVFTYLDYLLLSKSTDSEFRFTFRNSIEHFYPQNPDEEESEAEISEESLHVLGNLALVSVRENSRFSNLLPKAKANSFEKTIERQSPKLKMMADIARAHEWGDDQVKSHHKEMIGLLKADIEINHRPS